MSRQMKDLKCEAVVAHVGIKQFLYPTGLSLFYFNFSMGGLLLHNTLQITFLPDLYGQWIWMI